MLKDILEIILITYNRFDHLTNTLNSIFSEDSPIKNLNITIIDNASDDGTEQLCINFSEKHSNIQYLRNRKNIGGNASIVRAFEIAQKKYLWVLCDDDSYDWTYWDEIEYGLVNDYDAIITNNITTTTDIPNFILLNIMTFLPAAIYKTDNITSDVLKNAYINIYNSMPHFSLFSYIINNEKKIYIPPYSIVSQGWDCKSEKSYTRDADKFIHFRQQHFNLFVGYINSAQMINEKKTRYKFYDNLYLGSSSFFKPALKMFMSNGIYKYNICDVFNGINLKQKFILFLALFVYLFKKIIYISPQKKIRPIEYIFSITNDGEYKVIRIFGFKKLLKLKKKTKKKIRL